MEDILCPSCQSDDIQGSPKPDGAIALECKNCSHVWDRVPRSPCRRCGSLNVTRSIYEGWSYDDLEEAAADTMASWEYVEREVFRCQKCNNEWVRSCERRKPPSKGVPLHVNQHHLYRGAMVTLAPARGRRVQTDPRRQILLCSDG